MSQEGGQAGKRGEGRQWEVATRRPGGYGGVVGSGSHLARVGRAARRRAGPGQAVRAGLSFVSSALGFCFASASFGRAGAGAPPPDSLLAVSPLSSEGEASAAAWTASDRWAPDPSRLASPQGAPDRGTEGSLQPEMPAALTSWQRDRVKRARTSLPHSFKFLPLPSS